VSRIDDRTMSPACEPVPSPDTPGMCMNAAVLRDTGLGSVGGGQDALTAGTGAAAFAGLRVPEPVSASTPAASAIATSPVTTVRGQARGLELDIASPFR